MELPLGGPALRHYTQSRPRPHRQKLNYRPCKPQETILESENEVLELMGRVDEGVEEFFTKKVLPIDILKKQDEELITVQETAPASSIPCPPPTKTLRRKLGDFFTLRKRKGLKSETSHEGRSKKASIADFIRPLRDVARAEKDKDKDRVKEHDKENEKEKAKELPSAGDGAIQETPAPGAPPLRGEAVPPRRALREGKSQSLILLSGSAASGTPNARNAAKRQMEGQHSFEQKLHLMLQRIGVAKPQPAETQNQEGEMKKAESEGTIIDSKPEPASKPRTMSASSDTRHQIRQSVSEHESAGKPPLLPKPAIKPGPTPARSGRNTPENELAEIQEGESSAPAKLSPSAAPSPPATASSNTSTIQTISNSFPDSTSLTMSPSSAVTATDSEICTDSVNATAAATIHTDVAEPGDKVTETSTTTTELSTATMTMTQTSSNAFTEPIATASISSVLTTQTLSVTSNTTTTTPSVTTSETVSAGRSESSTSITAPNLSSESGFPELNAIPSSDVTPRADGDDAAISVITTASFSSTSVSHVPPGVVTTISSATEVTDDSSLVTTISSATEVTDGSSSVTTISSATEVTDDSSLVTTISSATEVTDGFSSVTTISSATEVTDDSSLITTISSATEVIDDTSLVTTISSATEVTDDSSVVTTISSATEVTDDSSLVTTISSAAEVTDDSSVVTTISSAAEVSDDSSLVTTSSCVALVSSVTETSSPSNSCDTTATTVSLDILVTTSPTPISATSPSSGSTSTSTTITTATSIKPPTPTECITSASIVTLLDIPSPTDISVPSTSSALTTPTDITTTSTSLKHTVPSTTSSAGAAAVSSGLSTDSDPADANNPSNDATTSVSGNPVTDGHSTITAHPTTDGPGQVSTEEASSAESEEKMTHEEHKSLQGADDGKKNENPMAVSSDETRNEVQEESEDPKETKCEPPSGKEEGCGPDESLEDAPEQEEAKLVSKE